MLHAISTFMARIDAIPERLERLPALHGFDGADLLAVVVLVIGLLAIYALIDERHRSRTARWTPPGARPQPKPEEKKDREAA